MRKGILSVVSASSLVFLTLFLSIMNSEAKNVNGKFTLYYMPGAGSLATRILVNKMNVKIEYNKINNAEKKTQDGRDFMKINPLGYIPVLEMPNGEILTESPAIMQYLADNNAYGSIIPEVKTDQRYQMVSLMNFVATEIHTAGIYALASKSAKTPEDAKPIARERLQKNLSILNDKLGGEKYFIGKKLTIADIYIFVELQEIVAFLKVDISGFGNLHRFHKEMLAQDFVQESMKEEGLL